MELFELVERMTRDRMYGGYFETFERDWSLAEDQRVSEADPDSHKSMNTHLHLLEAYSGLARISADPKVERTLREVIELYSRGGNVAPVLALDGTLIEPLGIPTLNVDEIDALVAFLEALTDERVLFRRAPFDHPQLFVPNGHVGDHLRSADENGDGRADDRLIEIPAVGRAGGPPLPGFLEGPFGPD